MTIDRRQFSALAGATGLASLLAPGAALAQAKQFFRIGTGGTAGTYYPIGGLIANAITTATVDASAVATNGSVANVNGIVGGGLQPV
ncbi:MAG: hypothetical protein FD152_3909 [Xanthobacteraceae bacterium]|nr:MAG: hypothetical protein FD152_3909 [Xanthobacteraceae bacterium]